MLKVHSSLKDPAQKAAEQVNKNLSQALSQNIPVLLMLSGGSSFAILPHIDISFIRENVTITVLDERYTRSFRDNNFAQLSQKPFTKEAEYNKATFIDTRVQQDETLEALADRWSHALHTWRDSHPNGHIYIVQGIGQDGHTAGIIGKAMKSGEFMGTFEDHDVWVVGYRLLPTQSEYLERVTVTLSFLRFQVEHSTVFALGHAKEQIMRQVLQGQGYLSETPALIIQDMKNVDVFTDLAI